LGTDAPLRCRKNACHAARRGVTACAVDASLQRPRARLSFGPVVL
jgi:hypothetical protein